MKKYIALVLILIGAVLFSLDYRITTGGIEVEGRFIRYELGKDGVLKNVYVKDYRRERHVYAYTGDGFDVLDESTPATFSVTKEKEDVLVKFTYSDGLVKTFRFIDGPYYEFEVHLNKKAHITLPSVYDVAYDRQEDNIYASYYGKNKVVSICISNAKVEGNVTFAQGVKVYMGPPKKTLIKGAFPEYYTRIMDILKKMGVYGFYDAIFYPLVWFFYWLYSLTGNFGWAIIIFTFIVRFVLYPLYHAQTKSLIKMRKIQKDVERIRKKYKDPRKQQEELMKLYREKGVNPMSGCLMMLIQLPIFFMLWGVLRFFEEEFAYGKPFLIWKDLSVGGFANNILLVLITVIASFYNSLITSQDSRTAWQGIIMSVIFPFLFISLPSGLFLYYTTNTLIQLVVTYYIYKRYRIKGLTVRELLGLPKKA